MSPGDRRPIGVFDSGIGGFSVLAALRAELPVEDFISTFKKPLTQPILESPPRLRTTRAARAKEIDDEGLIPKRSARLAAKSKFRALKPEAQARKVTMKRIGLNVETEALSAYAQEFLSHQIFRHVEY